MTPTHFQGISTYFIFNLPATDRLQRSTEDTTDLRFCRGLYGLRTISVGIHYLSPTGCLMSSSLPHSVVSNPIFPALKVGFQKTREVGTIIQRSKKVSSLHRFLFWSYCWRCFSVEERTSKRRGPVAIWTFQRSFRNQRDMSVVGEGREEQRTVYLHYNHHLVGRTLVLRWYSYFRCTNPLTSFFGLL